MLLIPIRI